MKIGSNWAVALALSLLAPLAAAPSQTPVDATGPGAKAQEPIPKVYAQDADAKLQIQVALKRAQKENKRVLIQLGGNWCHWCLKLHDLMRSDRKIATQLRSEYEVVQVDIGRFDKNLDLVEKYQAPLKQSGVPFLIVLDASGKVVKLQETGVLEKGQQHDPAKVLAFLTEHQAPRVDAFKVLEAAQKRVRKEKKSLLVHLGAPW